VTTPIDALPCHRPIHSPKARLLTVLLTMLPYAPLAICAFRSRAYRSPSNSPAAVSLSSRRTPAAHLPPIAPPPPPPPTAPPPAQPLSSRASAGALSACDRWSCSTSTCCCNSVSVVSFGRAKGSNRPSGVSRRAATRRRKSSCRESSW